MKIRKSYDKKIAIELHEKTFSEDYFDDNPTNEYWLVHNEDNRPVGFCMLRLLNLDEDSVFLSRAGLLEEARGKGLHTRMIRVRLAWAKKNGFKSALTYTSQDNATSYHNLQKCGFRLYWPDSLYAGQNFLYWMRSL